MQRLCLVVCLWVIGTGVTVSPAALALEDLQLVPLERAHAHNDYEHDRPLFDALAHGFTSVEADIWLVDGEFYVAHDFDGIERSRTLRSLYLDPLRERVTANGGSVHGEGTGFNLLIDVKSAAAPAWAALAPLLAEYADILTGFSGKDGRIERAVTVHISGNRDSAAMAAAGLRYAGIDGRLSRPPMAAGQIDPGLYTMMSQNWDRLFDWDGTGPMPAEEEAALAAYAALAQENGQLLRFWNTPDRPGPARDAVWEKLVTHEVDLINTDDLAGLREFLLAHDPSAGVELTDRPGAGRVEP